ncbi:hypothetical protein TEA_023696 [Camellia sinensis var. sinensis]|uniref:Uncharacterized protein n=1 Tax=Camellia sinensis var. sinensis TaxID=542762 RepID=A0A4S4D1Q2_CAMSN|nr:hypothetical protein TEA_023696 [Camellia sinensis var. sinensis]
MLLPSVEGEMVNHDHSVPDSSPEVHLRSVFVPLLSSSTHAICVRQSSNEAYVTLLYSDEFLLGVQVLGKSIRDTGSTKDMVVLVSDGVSDYATKLLQVSADGIIISGHSLAIDESSMTGESKILCSSNNELYSPSQALVRTHMVWKKDKKRIRRVRPGPRPYECVRRAWHSDRHQPIRGSLIKEIFRVVNEIHGSATKKNKEWQEKLPIVVLKAEEIMYSKANSEAEYMDLKTLWDRANDAINTIIRRDESTETGEFLQPCIEAALYLGCIPEERRGANETAIRDATLVSALQTRPVFLRAI